MEQRQHKQLYRYTGVVDDLKRHTWIKHRKMNNGYSNYYVCKSISNNMLRCISSNNLKPIKG